MKKYIDRIKKKIASFTWLDDVQYVYLLSGIVFFVALILIVWFGVGYVQQFVHRNDGFDGVISPKKAQQDEVPCDYRRLLDGVCVDQPKEIHPRLTAVMIENSSDAWPLDGLADAQVVYEAPVEGDIPRFMAIYAQDAQVDRAGPVRSARPYFLDWVSEYRGAMYMHVGGSPEALDQLKTYKDIIDVNEFYRGWYFWRDKKRKMPHNTFTSSDLWNQSWEKIKTTERVSYSPWIFEPTETCTDACAEDISIGFGAGRYTANWEYTSSTKQYQRSQGRKTQRDASGEEIFADTIIIQSMEMEVIDDIGRKNITTIGSGKVVVLRAGHAIEGTWVKESRTGRTHFYDENKRQITLQPGKIWIEIVPVGAVVSW